MTLEPSMRTRSFRPFRFTARLRLPFLGTALVAAVCGCPGSSTTTTSAPVSSGAAQQEIDDKCQIVVESMHDIFQLSKLGQTTLIRDGVQRLNEWLRSCAGESVRDTAWPERLDRLLSAEQREIVKSPGFTFRDGEHVQDGVMFRSLARPAFETGTADASELQRAAAAFRYVIRAIELQPGHPADVPLTPYEIALLGKGTVADRAWIFAELLRQEKIDAVIVAPAPPEGAAATQPTGHFLVGVLLEGGTYLFDPQLGVPVPGPGSVDRPHETESIATLEQAAGDAAVLKQLDVDEQHAYPLKSSDLQRPAVWLITDVGYWSDRMRAVQTLFAGENSMVVADPLHDTDAGTGLWSRVEKAGADRWNADAMRIWGYPESQISGHAGLVDPEREPSMEQRAALATLLAPYGAYLTVRQNQQNGQFELVGREQVADPAAGQFDPVKRMAVRTTAGSHMRTRLAHLDGKFDTAVQQYQDVWRGSRIVSEAPLNDEQVRNMHGRAVDDARFWIAACKFEQGAYRVAADALAIYRKRHPQGAWTRQARYLMALSLAAEQKYEQAMAEFDAVEPDDPEFLGRQWLVHKWQSALDAAQSKPASGEEQPVRGTE